MFWRTTKIRLAAKLLQITGTGVRIWPTRIGSIATAVPIDPSGTGLDEVRCGTASLPKRRIVGTLQQKDGQGNDA